MARLLSTIAREIQADFESKGKPVHPYAKPYVDAMFLLSTMDDKYIYDSADSIVRYALSNLTSWRGEKAREIKAELKSMLN